MKIFINGYTFSTLGTDKIYTEYDVPNYLNSDASICAYVQMVFEKLGYQKYMFAVTKMED